LAAGNTTEGVTVEIESHGRLLSDDERLGSFREIFVQWKTAPKPLDYAEGVRNLCAQFPDRPLREIRRCCNRCNYDFEAAARARRR
jgi:hypothetical protein